MSPVVLFLILAAPPMDRSVEIAAEIQRTSAPSTISLSGRLTTAQLTEAFHRETGQRVTISPHGAMSVDWRKQSFWKAVGDVERSLQLVARGSREQQGVVLARGGASSKPRFVASDGPVRVELLKATRKPNLVDPASDLLQVQWRIVPEPRLRPLYVAVSDADCSLTVGAQKFATLSPEAKREIPCPRFTGCEVDSSFPIPRDFATDDLSFEARFRMTVAARPIALTFPKLKDASVSQREGVTAVMRNVKSNPEDSSVSFTLDVVYDRGGPEFESHRLWIDRNSAWLESAEAGQRVDPDSMELLETRPNGSTVEYWFSRLEGPLDGHRFVYEAPSLLVDVPVTVELPSREKKPDPIN
jgi:hypothetical protein